MKRILVIFNPAARGEKAQRLRQFLMSKASDLVTLAPTQGPGDATRLAATPGYDLVVAAGGDGTVNEIVNGLNGATLGILPLGTVNVFAKELGLPDKLEAAWTLLETGTTRAVDLGCAEFDGKRRYFVQLAGVGFDARAVRAASWALKKKIGPLAYVLAGMRVLRERHARIEVGDLKGAAIFIGNGRFYGGRFQLFPRAKLDDGLLDVCVFAHRNLLQYLPSVLRGKHLGRHGVFYFQASEFTCDASEVTPLELDGEDAGDTPARFTVKPGALRVISAPRSDSST